MQNLSETSPGKLTATLPPGISFETLARLAAQRFPRAQLALLDLDWEPDEVEDKYVAAAQTASKYLQDLLIPIWKTRTGLRSDDDIEMPLIMYPLIAGTYTTNGHIAAQEAGDFRYR